MTVTPPDPVLLAALERAIEVGEAERLSVQRCAKGHRITDRWLVRGNVVTRLSGARLAPLESEETGLPRRIPMRVFVGDVPGSEYRTCTRGCKSPQ